VEPLFLEGEINANTGFIRGRERSFWGIVSSPKKALFVSPAPTRNLTPDTQANPSTRPIRYVVASIIARATILNAADGGKLE
jgi:hypothetical protein